MDRSNLNRVWHEIMPQIRRNDKSNVGYNKLGHHFHWFTLLVPFLSKTLKYYH